MSVNTIAAVHDIHRCSLGGEGCCRDCQGFYLSTGDIVRNAWGLGDTLWMVLRNGRYCGNAICFALEGTGYEGGGYELDIPTSSTKFEMSPLAYFEENSHRSLRSLELVKAILGGAL